MGEVLKFRRSPELHEGDLVEVQLSVPVDLGLLWAVLRSLFQRKKLRVNGQFTYRETLDE